MLRIAHLSKSLDIPRSTPIDALRDLNLAVEAGQVVSILGRSGSGKTTLLNVLGLLDRPTSGRYEVAGKDTAALSERARSRLRGNVFGFVFQHFHLLEKRTALENVAAPLAHAPSRAYARRWDRAADLLGSVGLGHRLYSRPSELSGGEQQRVALARSLVRSPSVILADEPTGSLDEDTGSAILDLFLTLARDQGIAVVLVTHDRAVADRSDQILELIGGSLHEASRAVSA